MYRARISEFEICFRVKAICIFIKVISEFCVYLACKIISDHLQQLWLPAALAQSRAV